MLKEVRCAIYTRKSNEDGLEQKFNSLDAQRVPLLDHEAREVFFKGVIKFFTGRNVEKEYEDLIKIKNYLNYNKKIALKVLENPRISAVVQFPRPMLENYAEVIKVKMLPLTGRNKMTEPGDDMECITERRYINSSTLAVDPQNANLSSLDIRNSLDMKLYDLRADKLETIECVLSIHPLLQYLFYCADVIDTQVYILNEGVKHIPHFTKGEYNRGLRYFSVPWNRPAQVGKDVNCGKFNEELGRPPRCNVDKVHRYCEEIFSFSGEPIIFTNNSNPNNGKGERSPFTGKIIYLPGLKNMTAATDYPAEMYVTGGTGVYFIGSGKRETTFVVNEPLEGILKGSIGKENAIIINFQSDYQIIANLSEGVIRRGDSSTTIPFIRLVNIYNYVSSSSSKQTIVTHCNTTFVNAKNAEILQEPYDCQSRESIVLNEMNKYHRGSKQAHLLVSKNSTNSEIIGDSTQMDTVEIIDTNIKQLKITEDIKEGIYILNLLADDTQSVISSVRIDSFENLVIKGKYSDSIDIHITMQNKALLPSFTKEKNSSQGLRATIQAKILNLASDDAYQVARDIADNNNLDILIHKIEVVEGDEFARKVIISRHTDQIKIDFNCVSQSTSPYSYCQNVDVEGGNQYVISLPEVLEHESSPETLWFFVGSRRRNSVFDHLIRFTMLDSIDVRSVNIKEYDEDVLFVEMKTDKGILSIGLFDYSSRQYVILQMNNKFYGIDDVGLELERLEKVNSGSIRYYVPEENGLQVYHNQPVDRSKIGLVDLKGKSVLDCNMKVTNNSLLLHNNNTIVKVENWGTYQPARKMMFGFSNVIVSNSRCITSICHSGDVIAEFKTMRRVLGEKELFKAVGQNNLDRVVDLINNLEISLNIKNGNGSTLLQLSHDRPKIAEFLKATEGTYTLSLLNAAKKGDLGKVKNLIDKGANVNGKDGHGNTSLHLAAKGVKLNVVKYLVDEGADIDCYGKEALALARNEGRNRVVHYLEKELNKRREKPMQCKHRHHHGDHSSHHSSRKLLAIGLSSQPEIMVSSSIRPSSWINDLFGWIRSSVSGLLSSELPKVVSSTKSPISQPMDVNGTIVLLDMLIRKVTGQKYISTVDQSMSPLEVQGYTLNITKGFEKVVEQAGLKSGVSMHRLNIDFVEIQKEVTGKIMSGKFDEISGVLNSYLEEACPGREAGCPGKLSEKKFNEFMAKFNKGLDVIVNQSIQQILHKRDDTLEVNNIEKQQGPRSYLNNTSIQGHLTRNKVELIS